MYGKIEITLNYKNKISVDKVLNYATGLTTLHYQ